MTGDLELPDGPPEPIQGLLIAPTEPPILRSIGRTTALPERFGVDVLWMHDGQRYGVQRKELSDLLASVRDGRLGKELGQIHQAGLRAVLVVEGRATWTSEGIMAGEYGPRWSKQQHWGVQLAVQLEGVWLVQTSNLRDTIAFIRAFYAWTKKKTHGSLNKREAPKGIWGTKATDQDFARHILTSFPGIGPEAANRIFEEFGRTPLRWDCTEDELLKIKGLGKKRVAAIRKVLE